MSESKTTKLSDIADVISGYAFKSQWFGQGSDRVIRIGDLHDEKINLDSAITIDNELHNVSKKYRLKKNDILMALSGATTGKIAIATERDEGAFLNQRIAIIRGRTKESSSYLKYVFSGDILKTLLLSAGGAAQANLSPRSLMNLDLNIPSLPEQRRIAAILDKADAIRRKRQATIKMLDEFLRSVFLDMFGDPVRNEKGWKAGTIRDVVDKAQYGTSKPAHGSDGQYPILRMGNITYEGSWDFSDLKYIDLDEKELPKYLAKRGDLLFNRTNSKELVGKTAVFEEDDPMAIAGYLIRVRFNQRANPYYVSGYLNSTHGKKTLMEMCKSIVGMANINAQELQNIKILIPPIAQQNKYAQIVNETRSRIAKLRSTLKTNEELFATLTQRAFRGEL